MGKNIDVGYELTECLRRLGAIVSDDTSLPNKPKNADFWFPSTGVAAELKCMSTNYFADKSFLAWVTDRYTDWVKRKLVPPGLHKINLASCPPICYQEVTSFVRKRIESSLKGASKQINATKQHTGRYDSTGLLLLVNDGNFGLVPTMLRDIVARSIHKYSGINTVVHFTANMPGEIPGIDKDLLYWCEWSKKSVRQAVDSSFLDHVRNAWLEHYASVAMRDIQRIDGSNEDLSQLRYIR